MKKTDVIKPLPMLTPIAANGTKDNIPQLQSGATDIFYCSIEKGFPDITMQAMKDGGFPPRGQGANGLFYITSDHKAYTQHGGIITFEADVSDFIGGYPEGAVLDYITDQNEFYKVISLIDDNTYNFVETPSYIDDEKWSFLKFNTSVDGFAYVSLSNLNATGIDFVNQSKALETGSVSSNSTVYADVYKYAHSTYDNTKFTVNGTPTITADGVASGLTYNNYLQIPMFDVSLPFDFVFKIKTPSTKTAQYPIIAGQSGGFDCGFVFNYNTSGKIRLVASTSGSGWNLANGDITQVLNTDTDYYIRFAWSGTQYFVYTSTDGKTWTQEWTVNSSTALASTGSGQKINLGTNNNPTASTQPYPGSIYLQYLSVKSNGLPFFSGNQTGTDTVTIGGSSVTIPYTLSKTGSKIVDSAYRTQITALYNQEGIAKYYTIDEANGDFTLPAGEIYGMMRGPEYADKSIINTNGYTVKGSLTLNSGILSGFSSSNFAYTSIPINTGSDPWYWEFEVTTGNDVNTMQGIIGYVENLTSPIQIWVTGTKFAFAVASAVDATMFEQSGSYTVLPNTHYYIKAEWTGTDYVLSYKLNANDSYVTDITVASTTPMWQSRYMALGIDSKGGDRDAPFLGSITLAGTNLYVNNVLTWSMVGGSNTIDVSGNKPTVITDVTYSNGSYCRVYSDGWCEQGGVFHVGQNGWYTTLTINLLKPFVDLNYMFNRSPHWVHTYLSGATGGYSEHGYYAKTLNSVTIGGAYPQYISDFNWYACGYVA